MIYNNARLANTPWELIIKAYRKHLGLNSFDILDGYRSSLVDFLSSPDQTLVSRASQLDQSESFYFSAFSVLQKLLNLKEKLSRGQLDTAVANIDFMISKMDSMDILLPLTQDDLAREIEEQVIPLSASLSSHLQKHHDPELVEKLPIALLAELVIKFAFRHWQECFDGITGLVIVGYGEGDLYPGLVNLEVYGFFAGKLLSLIRDSEQISETRANESIIKSFAQSSAVDSFTKGCSEDVYAHVENHHKNHSISAIRKYCDGADFVFDESLAIKLVEIESAEFQRNWSFAVWDNHLKPMWGVLGGFSATELAELAETLVQLESIKEKVTRRTQSVGGPIDVAVITKSEGLVWIKRKLYFDPSLNQRYFQRTSL